MDKVFTFEQMVAVITTLIAPSANVKTKTGETTGVMASETSNKKPTPKDPPYPAPQGYHWELGGNRDTWILVRDGEPIIDVPILFSPTTGKPNVPRGKGKA